MTRGWRNSIILLTIYQDDWEFFQDVVTIKVGVYVVAHNDLLETVQLKCGPYPHNKRVPKEQNKYATYYIKN